MASGIFGALVERLNYLWLYSHGATGIVQFSLFTSEGAMASSTEAQKQTGIEKVEKEREREKDRVLPWAIQGSIQ